MRNRKSAPRRRVRRSSHAKLDLIQAWLFIAQDNPSAADQLLRAMNKHIHMLAHAPRMGRNRDNIRHGLYSFPVKTHVIFYTMEEDGITIVRVLHAARDVKANF